MKRVSLWGAILVSVLAIAMILAGCAMFVAPAPKDLSATALSSNSIQLTWNSTAKTFVVYRSLSNGNFAEVATVQSTSYTDKGLNPSTTYFYQVKAKNQYGLSNPSNVASATTLMLPPQAPVLNVTNFSTNTISLSWSESQKVDNFTIYRAIKNSAFAQLTTLQGNISNYSDKNLTPETTYSYKIIASNKGGNSQFSNVVVQMTNGLPPLPPSNLSVTDFSTNSINLSWKNPKNITGLEIYQSTNQSSVVKTLPASLTTYMATNLLSSTLYTFKLRAFNKWGYSDFSNIVSQMTSAFGSYFPLKEQVNQVEISAGVPLVDTLSINPVQRAFEDFFNSHWFNLGKQTNSSSFTIKEDIMSRLTVSSTNATIVNYEILIPQAYKGEPRQMESLSFEVTKAGSTVFYRGIPLIDNANIGNATGTAILKSPQGTSYERSSSYLSLSVGTKTYNDVLKVDLILNNLKREFYFARNLGMIKLENYLNENNLWKFISALTVIKPDIGKFEYNPSPAIPISPKVTDLSTSTQVTMTWESTGGTYELYLERMGEWIKKIGSSTQTHLDLGKLPTGIYSWIVVTSNASGLSTASKVATFTVNMGKQVTFNNPQLESIVRSILNIPEGPLYESELSKITEIKNNWPSNSNMLSNLDGIEYLTNLATLDLVGNNISDISPLKGLKLKSIDLSYNHIKDISALSTMTSLISLDLSHNEISDITPLASLTSLKMLNLSSNDIENINAIKNLKNLESLDLSSNHISDVTPIEDLGQSILSLDISYNPIPFSQLKFIENWTQLHNLGMSGFNLDSSQITFVSKFSSLRSLDLGFNRLTNITPLASLTGLRELFLYSNMIKDISPLANLKNLEWLNAGANMISNLTPLQNLNNLKFLDLEINNISDISPLLSLSNLEILNLNFNRINLKYTPSFNSMLHLIWLMLNSNDVSDFTIVSTAPDLWILELSSNKISDTSPLGTMKYLLRVDLSSNKINSMNAIINDMYLKIGSIVDISGNQVTSSPDFASNVNKLEGRGIKVIY
ncbi:leucine-rich repeat domain-containing protein [Athalassotoga saccharophila]|uniref:leucine-rich repeat domain-containing protein n=1 Tax=Athalassotoga saccharophila TaxID=1441386 RepID=UPI00137AD655|nr:leucine-rich repeat domain-containing protein [Athalassotoga saccharophila]BBJ28075.1 internalin-A [Athalassotoga saccharophila]